jgi:hypothetical protein
MAVSKAKLFELAARRQRVAAGYLAGQSQDAIAAAVVSPLWVRQKRSSADGLLSQEEFPSALNQVSGTVESSALVEAAPANHFSREESHERPEPVNRQRTDRNRQPYRQREAQAGEGGKLPVGRPAIL